MNTKELVINCDTDIATKFDDLFLCTDFATKSEFLDWFLKLGEKSL
jgi:hypothetical protein